MVFESANAENAQKKSDLFDIDLEGLMNIKVSSVSKKVQKTSDVAAAVFVITSEDIARSTATSIPELLRMVPGLQVAQLGAGKWAITARGFNSEFGDKLLVMIDGRSVYSPIFGGVFWDVQDTIIEDIDRIEVVRGPGASVWGANAVNGVINIITKSTERTQGTLVSGGTGTETSGFANIRHGGVLSPSTHYKIYSKYFNHDGSKREVEGKIQRAESENGYEGVQGGFRVDTLPTSERKLTLSGDAYYQDQASRLAVPTFNPPFVENNERNAHHLGGNVILGWSERWSEDADTDLQIYFDQADRHNSLINASVRTLDIDVQNRIKVNSTNEFVWGFDYRFVADNIEATYPLNMEPSARRTSLVSGFAQDEISLFGSELKLTLGTKLEHNDYTGFEVQPTARIMWAMTETQRLWGAVSRAVRTPARTDRDVVLVLNTIPGPSPDLSPAVSFDGSHDFDSENLLAIEAGYRFQPRSSLYFGIDTFFNTYSNLGTYELGTPRVVTQEGRSFLNIPSPRANFARASVYGFEALIDWEAHDWWRVQMSYGLLQMETDLREGSTDQSVPLLSKQSPQNQASLRSLLDISDSIRFDTMLRYVDSLPDYSIDGYIDLDVRVAYQLSKELELSLNGVNLLHEKHVEFRGIPVLTEPSGIERAGFIKLTAKF